MFKRSIGFEVQEMLGEGGQGRVFRALRRDPQSGLSQIVALKILHSENTVESWKNEFTSLAKVRSLYCVRVLGFERVNQRPALVLEYVDGVSLAALGVGCWLAENDILEILSQCEAAVLDLLKFGEFHGDLSPQNILIDVEGRIRLLDFGMANSQRATVDFAAPERFCGQPASLAADIFSIGRIEQFLRGREPGPDEQSPYLAVAPDKRSLRGLFSCEERRKDLAEKVRSFQQRRKLSRFAKTRTQILAKSRRSASIFLALITACMFSVVSGAEKAENPKAISFLNIRTLRWHSFRIDGATWVFHP